VGNSQEGGGGKNSLKRVRPEAFWPGKGPAQKWGRSVGYQKRERGQEGEKKGPYEGSNRRTKGSRGLTSKWELRAISRRLPENLGARGLLLQLHKAGHVQKKSETVLDQALGAYCKNEH